MRILIIEDDIDLSYAIKFHLEKEGYSVDVCHDGDDGLHFMKQQAHGLIILDRMLPELDGISALSTMRTLGITTPVIMTTALNGIGDRVKGLDSGADDYLVKPFAIEELLARIRAIARRPAQWDSNQNITLGDIFFDSMRSVIKGPDTSCSLSKREADLIEVLLRNPGQTIPRAILLSKVWGPDAPVEDGNLDNYIHFLRRRLKTVGSSLNIKTVRSIGYNLEVKNV